ncbi:hypothetical protein RHU54_003410 [Salmonella enterica]|nr:hypothetical protein [Salmonella enterica]
MKTQIAIAALTIGLASAAYATPNITTSTGSNGEVVVGHYDFDYTSNAPSVAPVFTTTVTSAVAGDVADNTPLAYTSFIAPTGTQSIYKLTANYSGAAELQLQSYLNTAATVGTAGNLSATNVAAGDQLFIVLATSGTTLAAGTTHVTYTVNSYAS